MERLMAMKERWYQIMVEKIRVIPISRAIRLAETKKTPRRYLMDRTCDLDQWVRMEAIKPPSGLMPSYFYL